MAQAASLGLAILEVAKVDRWDDLGATMPAQLVIDDAQYELLVEFSYVFRWVSPAHVHDGERIPTTTIAVCPVCGRYEGTTSDASSRCRLTLRCPGKPVKARSAKKVPLEPADTGQQTLPVEATQAT